MPATRAIASVNASAAASRRTLWSSGMVIASRCASDRVPATASAMPRTPPQHERATLSVSSCCTRRLRPAPSATRIAISFCRAAVRASSRFDRLAHTISMTTATAPARTASAGRTRPLTCSASGIAKPSNELRSGCARVICGPRTLSSASARSTVAPGLSRPITASVLPQRFVSGERGNGK